MSNPLDEAEKLIKRNKTIIDEQDKVRKQIDKLNKKYDDLLTEFLSNSKKIQQLHAQASAEIEE